MKTGGFLIPQNKIDKLIANQHLLSEKQKKDILAALQSGSGVRIKPTKTTIWWFPWCFTRQYWNSSSIESSGWKGCSKGWITTTRGKRSSENGYVHKSTTFSWHMGQTNRYGKKKNNQKKEKRKRSTVRTKKPIQSNSTSRGNTVKPKFHKDIPMSNHDLIKWCRYLNIPINDVLSRDEKVPHNHKQALFIYNLEPSYMSGSHWVTTYVKDNIINYFDSFGMPPFQELVNHAKRKNLTLLHQNNQIQNIKTTTCGYFCLYFLNEMNKGNSYFDLLKVFNIHDTIKNERFIMNYFKNI